MTVNGLPQVVDQFIRDLQRDDMVAVLVGDDGTQSVNAPGDAEECVPVDLGVGLSAVGGHHQDHQQPGADGERSARGEEAADLVADLGDQDLAHAGEQARLGAG